MGDDAAPPQVTTGVPGKVIVNGELLEPLSLRTPVAPPLAPAAQEPAWQPPPFPRHTRPKEPVGPLAPIEPLEPVEKSLGDFFGGALLWALGLVAVALVVYWIRN